MQSQHFLDTAPTPHPSAHLTYFYYSALKVNWFINIHRAKLWFPYYAFLFAHSKIVLQRLSGEQKTNDTYGKVI